MSSEFFFPDMPPRDELKGDALLAELQERLVEPVFALHPDSRVFYANPPAERLLGKPIREFAGQYLWEVIGASADLREAMHWSLRNRAPVRVPETDADAPSRVINTFPIRDGLLACLRYATLDADTGCVQNRRAEYGAEALRIIATMTGCLLWYADVEENSRGELLWNVHLPDEEAAMQAFPVDMAPGQSLPDALRAARTPEDAAAFNSGSEAAIRAGRDFRGLFRYRRKDDLMCWVDTRASVTVIAPGRWLIACVSLDVTELKKTEDRLRASELQFRQAFENVPIGMAIGGLDRRIIAANRALCEMLGYTAEQLVGLSFADLTHPDDSLNDAILLERIVRGDGPIQPVTKRYVARDGTVIWTNLTVTVIRDDEMQPQHILGMVENLSVRKRAEEAESLLSGELESSIDPMIAHAPDGAIIRWNAAAERFYGYTAEEALGKNVMMLPHPDVRSLSAARVGRVCREGTTELFESISQRKDGQYVETLIRVSPIRNGTGAIVGAATSVRDLSEMKQTRRDLERQKERMSAIRAIDAVMIESFDLRVVAEEIVRQVCATLGVDAAAILVPTDGLTSLDLITSVGFAAAELTGKSFPIEGGLLARIIAKKEPVLIPDLSESAGEVGPTCVPSAEGFVGYAAIPLTAKGGLAGILEVYHRAPLALATEEWEFLKHIATHAAVGINNGRMFGTFERAEAKSLQGRARLRRGDDYRPLTPALVKLLDTAVRYKTTDTSTLAGILSCSPTTVHTYWQRTCEILGAEGRFNAVMIAAERDLVRLTGR